MVDPLYDLSPVVAVLLLVLRYANLMGHLGVASHAGQTHLSSEGIKDFFFNYFLWSPCNISE